MTGNPVMDSGTIKKNEVVMKGMLITGVLFGLSVMVCSIVSANDRINVAILKGADEKTCADGIYEALSDEKDLEVSYIHDTLPATLKNIQVVIMPETRNIRSNHEKYEEFVISLRDWVKGGGGLMAIHDAVGYRRHDLPLFPLIAKGVHNDFLSRKPFFAEIRSEEHTSELQSH